MPNALLALVRRRHAGNPGEKAILFLEEFLIRSKHE